MLAVGGSSLTLGPGGAYEGETGWSGGGGGVSQFESEPDYQSGVQTTGYRTIPDVAFDGDSASGVAVADEYNSPIELDSGVGGTSLAAPCWAALVAIADQGREADGESAFSSSSCSPRFSRPSTACPAPTSTTISAAPMGLRRRA